MVSSTRRTAGCGPACPVVWQGRVGDHSPYADSVAQAFLPTLSLEGFTVSCEGPALTKEGRPTFSRRESCS